RMFLRPRGRILTGALAEDDQVRQRVSAEAVRTVDTRRALAGREQARDRGHLRVRIDADPAHDVVRGGPDFHRLLRDVEVRQLLELVIHARELPLDERFGVLELFLDPRDVEEHATVRGPAPSLDLAVDAARDVVACQQLRRTTSALVALGVAPAFLRVAGGLRFVVVRDVVEHEPAPLAVLEDATFTAHAFGHENPAHARRPYQPRGMELDELHVDQLGARTI